MNEQEHLQGDVDALRKRISDTRQLYREVCGVMFFKYALTPTANKLYQLVRKGSMGVPNEELAKFWADLREKSRVRIEHPDLPEALKQAAADAVQVVWQQATELAEAQWEEARRSSEAAMASIAAERDQMQIRLDAAQARSQELERQVAEADMHRRTATLELEAERRGHAATTARGDSLRQQVAELLGMQDQQRQAFSDELGKARAAVDAADARALAADHRALREIDQERQARSAAEKRAESASAKLADASLQSQARAVEAASESARLTAELQGVRRAAENLEAEVLSLRHAVSTSQTESSRASARAETLQAMVEKLQPNPPASASRNAGRAGKPKPKRAAL